MRAASAFLCLTVLAACSSAQPTPSICDLATFPAGWAGSDVHVEGLALGASPHGFVLVSTTCDRAVDLEMTDKALFSALDAANSRGLVSLDVTGKFVARDHQDGDGRRRTNGLLWIKTVRNLSVALMPEQARQAYWEARLRRRDAALKR